MIELLNRKIKPEEVGEKNRKRDYRNIYENNYPPR
jgi:hypothetical protein